jgi:hypothetical protein
MIKGVKGKKLLSQASQLPKQGIMKLKRVKPSTLNQRTKGMQLQKTQKEKHSLPAKTPIR